MNKKIIGWIINGILAVSAITLSIIFPNPAIIFPVVAGATITGTLQSIFTIVETRGEKEEKERARKGIYNTITNNNDRSSREKENLGEKEYIRMASSENSKSNPSPAKVFKNLHSNPNNATFSGMHKKNDQTLNNDEEIRL